MRVARGVASGRTARLCAAVWLVLAVGRADGTAWADALEVGAVAVPTIRVLLVPGEPRVVVSDRPDPRGAGRTVVEATDGGLLVAGRPRGAFWRVPGHGVKVVDSMQVRGDLELRRVADGVQVVNELSLEDYVAGTIGREVYPSWEPETLKAQAVVARTYAMYQSEHREPEDFDLVADTRSQVYGGIGAETPRLRAAVDATRGEYLAWNREPILAVYHAAAGGRTASSKEVWGRALPYLVSIEIDGEEVSPDTYWRVSISGTKLGRALAAHGVQIGSPREAVVVDRSPSGRALSVRIRGDEGSHTLKARGFRSALGGSVIRSTLFEIRSPRERGGDFTIVGSGHGHGVGMSQWGAQAMALAGASYREILETFYPGTSLSGGDG